MSKRPNIVLMMCDQQRWDMLSCNDNSFVKTPHLDRLAASGLNCKRCFTTTPVCTPARAALFTGLYSTSAGAFANQIPLHEGVKNIGQYFVEAGYGTGYIGKWHLDGPTGRYYGTGIAAEGFPQEWWYDGKSFINDVGNDGFKKWSEGKDLSDSDCWGTRVADRSCRFIESQSSSDRPFFLVASFDEPHGPSSAPERYYDMYRGTKRRRQPNFDDTLDGKPFAHRALESFQKSGGRVPAGEDPNNSPRFYGCNSYIDDQIGRVLDAIDRHCADNTIVVYTADHGDHAGAHGLLAKGATMYEDITRIPFLIRAPGVTQAGSVTDHLISHIDLPPTLFKLCGIPLPDTHDAYTGKRTFNFEGKDMFGLIQNPQNAGRDAVFMEYTRFGLPHSTRLGFTPIRCIRTETHKLVINLLDTDELYDLVSDPYETVNRINDSKLATLRNELHDRIIDWMDRREDPFRGNGWWQRSWRPEKMMPPDYEPKIL